MFSYFNTENHINNNYNQEDPSPNVLNPNESSAKSI